MKVGFKDLAPVYSENHRGGKGTTTFYHYLADYHAPGKVVPPDDSITCVVLVELAVGGVIGEHTHSEDEEVYIILSGEGVYTEDGNETPVVPRDALMLQRGHSHGMRNTGNVPLVFYAVVAR